MLSKALAAILDSSAGALPYIVGLVLQNQFPARFPLNPIQIRLFGVSHFRIVHAHPWSPLACAGRSGFILRAASSKNSIASVRVANIRLKRYLSMRARRSGSMFRLSAVLPFAGM